MACRSRRRIRTQAVRPGKNHRENQANQPTKIALRGRLCPALHNAGSESVAGPRWPTVGQQSDLHDRWHDNSGSGSLCRPIVPRFIRIEVIPIGRYVERVTISGMAMFHHYAGFCAALFGDDAVCPLDQRYENCGTAELCSPILQVYFRNPTGTGAGPSSKDRNVELAIFTARQRTPHQVVGTVQFPDESLTQPFSRQLFSSAGCLHSNLAICE